MKPWHSSLAPLLDLPRLTKRRIAFLSENAGVPEAWHKWMPSEKLRRPLYEMFRYGRMAIEAAKADGHELYLIFEHQPLYSPLLYAVLLLKRRPVLFVVHNIQQSCRRSFWHMLAFKANRWLVRRGRFYPIHMDRSDDCLPTGIRYPEERCLVIPHPHPRAIEGYEPNPDRWSRPRFRVGVIGALQNGKPARKLIEALIGMEKAGGKEFDLVLGVPFWQDVGWAKELGVELIDTSTEEDYAAALCGLNVCVFDFDESTYYFRPSGVINDAGIYGCYVICPRFPIFEAEISAPVAIGRTYAGYGDLPGVIDAALAELRAGPPDFARWRSHRKIGGIVERFERFFETTDGIPPRTAG